MNLKTIELELHDLYTEQKELVNKFEEDKRKLTNRIRQAEITKQLLVNDYNIDKIEQAKDILLVEGIPYAGYNEASRAIEDAILDVAKGVVYMRSKYIGCKNYEGWTCQREDHPYGYGPRHGSTVFKLGLRDSTKILSEEDIEACLYFLNSLKSEKFREILLRK